MNFKNRFALAQHGERKIRIGVAVQHQDVCSVAGRRLHSSDNDNNQVYVNMVDNFYVIVHTRIRRVILKQIITSRGAKDRAEQSDPK